MIHDHYGYWRVKPTDQDFSLEIISKHPDFNGRALKKYALDGINTVGVWGDEPFEVHFKNKSHEDVQVRISLDGTDVLTGKPANLEVNHDMWVVRAGRTLHLKAWAENSNGGARFVFTSGDKSVALHAHGDISHKGMISAAVFTERDRPIRPYTRTRAMVGSVEGSLLGGGSFGAMSYNAASDSSVSASAPMPASTTSVMSDIGEKSITASLRKEAAVGAGEYVEQRTRSVKGLDNPVLNSIVRVRYMWWDDVQTKLSAAHYIDPHPTGFPGEKIRSFADLSGVPRVASEAVKRTGIYAETRSVSTVETKPAGPIYNPITTTFDRFESGYVHG